MNKGACISHSQPLMERSIMIVRSNRVCPVERAGGLDNSIRRWLQNPRKVLGPYIKEGMTVLDLGCGPGFFSVEMAKMVGRTGRVIAADLQEGMLQKLKDKIQGTEIEGRLTLHRCDENKIGVWEKVDFVFAFYVVHEVKNQESFFNEIKSMLKLNGRIFIVEPLFHVSKTEFEESIWKAQLAGFVSIAKPRVFLSRAVIMKKG